jgi:hypothetical protein
MLAFLLALNCTAQERLHALILSGGESADWRDSTAFLKTLLEESQRFDVRINETPDGVTRQSLAAFDVVVDNCGNVIQGDAEKALDQFVQNGHGLVLTRRAVAAGRSAFGLPKSGTQLKDAEFHRFELKSIRPDHFVLQGVKTNWRTADRPLLGVSPPNGSEILAIADENQPALLAKRMGRGRVFVTCLGFDVGAMQEPAFITTFLRGTEWAASEKVTLPPEVGTPAPSTNSVRTLVITGGHDYETAFYRLFDGYKDLGWVPVNDSKIAFQQDIRGKYDVLIFYDFTRDMDEKARQNLRDFVESGKGIVVLHHGILDFQKWPWWYEEVVGGLYRLDRQGSIPNSTVKFGERHLITPVGQHPITAGIGPFEVTDETYKGLFISDKITPLLVTDNPTSDKTVAWIGPCRTSRVVFIQLGHDHSPFNHPSYRAIVHNSILWTAGKLN